LGYNSSAGQPRASNIVTPAKCWACVSNFLAFILMAGDLQEHNDELNGSYYTKII